MNMSPEMFCFGLMNAGLASSAILGFGVINVLSTGGMLDFRFELLTEVSAIAVVVAIDLRSGVMIGILTDEVIDINVLAGADANMWVATMTALESTSMLASPKGILLFGWKACS